MTADALLRKLRAQRDKLEGVGGMAFSPNDVTSDHGVDPLEAQALLLELEERGDLAKSAMDDYWCFPEDEARGF